MKALLITAAVFLLLITACTGTKVVLGEHNQFNSARYSGFAWAVPAIKNTGRNLDIYYLDNALRKAVTRLMVAKGYREVALAEADFQLDYRFHEEVDVDEGGVISPANELDSAWGTGTDIDKTALRNHYIPAQITRAVLELSVNDPKLKKELWEARATRVMENRDADQSTIDKAMKNVAAKLLQHFPARSSSSGTQ